MIMFEGKTTSKEIIDLVLKEIVRLGGLEKAFPHEGRIQLYTGPNRKYLKDEPKNPRPTISAKIRNSKRSEDQAKEWGATRPDDTHIGKFLFETNDVYAWFKDICTDKTTGDFDDTKFEAETKAITSFASALFIRTASGDVQTCVCGGERDRVFCETEMHGMCDRSLFPLEAATLVAELMANKDIESINGVSIEKYRRIYATGNYERVYRAICLAELRQRLHKAITRKTRTFMRIIWIARSFISTTSFSRARRPLKAPRIGKCCATNRSARRKKKRLSAGSRILAPFPRRRQRSCRAAENRLLPLCLDRENRTATSSAAGPKGRCRARRNGGNSPYPSAFRRTIRNPVSSKGREFPA